MRRARVRQPRWWLAVDAHNDRLYIQAWAAAAADLIDPDGSASGDGQLMGSSDRRDE